MQDVRNNNEWYAVRSLFRDEQNKFFEERTILVKAKSHKQALDRAELESTEYADNIGIDYSGYSETFQLVDEKIGDLAEVFSCMRYSNLDAEEYTKRFLKTGDEVNMD